MAPQTKIWIGLHQHLAIDGTVRLMTGSAALAQSLVLEDNTFRLLPMTAGALLIEPRHGETTGWFHNVDAMRVMALHAVHLAFADGMVLRQVELGMHFEMTGEACLRIAA